MAEGDELRRLCYGGEELLASTTVGEGTVGVTSHRVLVLGPDAPGPRFRAVDRPNVTGVAVRTGGPRQHRDRAIGAGIAATGLVIAGAVVDLGQVIQPVEPPAGAGLEGLFGIVETLIVALTLLDEALTLLGMLAFTAALASLAWYLRDRNRVLEITVAGGEPIRIPVAGHETGVADRLRTALAPTDGGSAPLTGQRAMADR